MHWCSNIPSSSSSSAAHIVRWHSHKKKYPILTLSKLICCGGRDQAQKVHLAYNIAHCRHVFAIMAVLLRNLHTHQHYAVSKPQWPRRVVIPEFHLHRQKTPASAVNYTYLSRAYLDVSDGVTHIWPIPRALDRAYVWTFRRTFLSMTHHVRTYVVGEDKSSIQSLMLMR